MKAFVMMTVVLVAVTAFLARGDEQTHCSITMPTDGGTASTADQIADGGCVDPGDGGSHCTAIAACGWGLAKSIFIQCDNPVRYSSISNGQTNTLKQRTPRTVVATDPLVDFDLNADAYRIDLRGQSQHLSVKSVSTSANTCNFGSVSRLVP